MNLSEKDSINDLLIQEKELIKVYGTFLPEGSTSQLRNILKKNMDVVAQQQYEVFNTMKNKGYYDMKNAENQQINETKKKFSKSASSN
jgi:spore coat protein CotF